MPRTIVKDKRQMMEEIRVLVSEGKTVSFTVKGHSMNPFMVHMRDIITLGPWTEKDIRRGTVALVRDINGNHLIHRIISRTDTHVILSGDGNLGMTETAEIKDIIAIMRSIERKGRQYSAQGIVWRAYSWFWMLLTPVRRWPLGLWRRFNRKLVPPLHEK